jgi:hypothetical protein
MLRSHRGLCVTASFQCRVVVFSVSLSSSVQARAVQHMHTKLLLVLWHQSKEQKEATCRAIDRDSGNRKQYGKLPSSSYHDNKGGGALAVATLSSSRVSSFDWQCAVVLSIFSFQCLYSCVAVHTALRHTTLGVSPFTQRHITYHQ